jgi:ABC-type phosphate transport system substrate-binding protein
MTRLFLLVAALVLGSSAGAEAQSYQIIVNSANPVVSLSKADISRMFLKKTLTWPDGKPIAAVDRDRKAKLREVFSSAIHGRSASAIVSYWQQQIFSGQDVPPPEKTNDADVVAFVQASPGAVGYVSSGIALSGVKPITVGP